MLAQRGGDLEVFSSPEEIPPIARLTEADLFSRPKTFVFEGMVPELGETVNKIIESQNHIIISVQNLDKRKKENKDLFSNPKVKVQEFSLPHGTDLNKWIENRVKELDGRISKPAVEELAVRLGRDLSRDIRAGGKLISSEEVYTLWQTESEIQKLLDLAKGRQVEQEDVVAVVPENLEVDAFEIINAIGEGKKQKALDLMQIFLKAETASDEKGGVIKLNALLSDQMRSIAIIQDFERVKAPDTEIIKQTGWKSGRVYIMKKIALRLPKAKVLETMKKLEALDEELKTSQTPPRVLLDMIVTQIF